MSYQPQGFVSRFFLTRELNLIYLSVFLMTFAESLIAIFVPVYLYSLGYSVSLILFFYFLWSLFFVTFSLTGAKIVARIGIKHAILLSTPFALAYYLLLNFIDVSIGFFLLLPGLAASHAILYNYAFHLNFLKHSEEKRRGRQLAFLKILEVAATALGPLLGGFLIMKYGFFSLYFTAGLFLIGGAVVLLAVKEKYESFRFHLKGIGRYLLARENRGNFLSFIGYAVEASVNRNIWPIFLIILLVNARRVGTLVTLSVLTSAVVFYLVGQLTDRVDRKRLLKWATGFYFLAWLMRVFVNSGFRVWLVDSYKNLAEKFLSIPWAAHSYRLAAADRYFMFIVAREIVFNISRIVFLPLLMLVFYLNFHPFTISFISAAFFSLLYPLLRK